MSGGLLGAAAALATVIAAIVGTLNQLGYIGNHEASRPAGSQRTGTAAEEPASAPGSAIPDEARSGAGSPASSSPLASIRPGTWRTLPGRGATQGWMSFHNSNWIEARSNERLSGV